MRQGLKIFGVVRDRRIYFILLVEKPHLEFMQFIGHHNIPSRNQIQQYRWVRINRVKLHIKGFINQLESFIIIKFTMAEEEDYSKPRNLALSMFRDDFGDIELGQNSKIVKNVPAQNMRQSKYQEEIDDDFLNMDLGAESKFTAKLNSASSSTNSSKSQPKDNPKEPSNPAKNVASKIQRRGRKPQSTKKAEPVKKQVDIDREIGEIAEWAERGAKNNSDQQDFNDNQGGKAAESEEQLQIRKKIEEKLKGGFNTEKQGGGGLRAKAQQLRKQNENKVKLDSIKQQASNISKQSNLNLGAVVDKKKSRKQIEEDINNSNIVLNKKEKHEPKINPNEDEEEDIDNHWDKINQKTVNQISKAEEKRKQMNIKLVLSYYQKEFQFDEKDIDDDMIGKNNSPQEEEKQDDGFFANLCACLSGPKKSKPTKYNFSLARRLVAISKKQLSNVEEEFFLLKEIWVRLTGKQFSRYGSHWNQIGFQGRDPATDLRSTGVLSLLQWIQFIQTHAKLSEKYYLWSLEQDFPLALTFIKLTGVFLDLLSKGEIRCENWTEFQRSFNCLALGMFQKMTSKFKLGDTLGNFVEQQAKQIKKEYKKLYASYKQDFKSVK